MSATYKVLYGNDTFHATYLNSPYHHEDEGFKPDKMAASVREVADTAVDAQLFQMGSGRGIPCYPSEVYSLADHLAWWESHYGVHPFDGKIPENSLFAYLLDGGDLIQVMIDACRETGQAPFISHRLNDVHGVEHAGTPGNRKGAFAIDRFYAEHLDWRLGANPQRWPERPLNWKYQAVRDYMLALIEEECNRYDIEGYELDFMRFGLFFPPDDPSFKDRIEIMTAFVARVREILDRSVREGRSRKLCVRIPVYSGVYPELGVDLKRWRDAGVNMVNLAHSYCTSQDGDLAALRAQVPDLALYIEMTHAVSISTPAKACNNGFTVRRTTPNQLYTTAHLAYERGFNGVSLYNFPYYRLSHVRQRGAEAEPYAPGGEPPFEVLKHLDDPEWLKTQPKFFFLGHINSSFEFQPNPLPAKIEMGQVISLKMDAAFVANPQTEWIRLRIQCEQALGISQWEAWLDDEALMHEADCSEPFNNPYPLMLRTPEYHRAWRVPVAILTNGMHTITLKLVTGLTDAKLVFVDLVEMVS